MASSQASKRIVPNFAAVVFFCLLSIPAGAKTITVCLHSCSIRSVAAAVQSAVPGDRVLIKKGVYHEKQIFIYKPLELVGEHSPVLDGDNRHEVITVKSGHVAIRGLTVRNTGYSDIEDRAGIKLIGSKNDIIEGNTLLNNQFAIYLANASRCVIRDNRIEGNAATETRSGNGIHLWHSQNILIEKNKISQHRDGIYFEFVSASKILGNTSTHNLRYGLHFMFSDGNAYTGNVFSNNGSGVAVMYSKNVTMKHNRFERNWGAAAYGLLLKEIKNSLIAENIFSQNTVGVQADGTVNLDVEKNNFKNNGWALRLLADSTGNRFVLNNFMGNSFDVASNSTVSRNDFHGNYWDDDEGYDLNKDGTADVPFVPVRLSSVILENYPACSILLRSPLFFLLDLSQRAVPALTPDTLSDTKPSMKKITW